MTDLQSRAVAAVLAKLTQRRQLDGMGSLADLYRSLTAWIVFLSQLRSLVADLRSVVVA